MGVIDTEAQNGEAGEKGDDERESRVPQVVVLILLQNFFTAVVPIAVVWFQGRSMRLF